MREAAMIFGRGTKTENRGTTINHWVAEIRRVASESRDDGLSQVEVFTSLSLAIGIEAASAIHVEYSTATVDGLLITFSTVQEVQPTMLLAN